MRRLFNAVLLAGLIGIPSASLGAAADADAAAAVQNHFQCVINNAAKLDDGQMTPKQLAELIAPLCRVEHLGAIQATSPQLSNEASMERAKALEIDHTIAAVLFYRDRDRIKSDRHP